MEPCTKRFIGQVMMPGTSSDIRNDELRHPLVTINIPTYNQEKYIARAIESCLEQDYPNLEIIVCDDCSTDNTYLIAKEFATNNVKVFRNTKNLGRVGNYRHILYDLSQGEWIANLDGDDFYLDKTFISEAIKRLLADNSIIMYAAGAKVLHEETGITESVPMGITESSSMPGIDYVLAYPKLEATQHFAIVYNRSLALSTDFYSLDSLGTDTDSILRLAMKGKVFVQNKYVGVWTHHRNNASYSLTNDMVHKEIRMFQHVAEELKKHVSPDVAGEWLERQTFNKKRFIENLTLSKLPLKEAWKYYREHKQFNFFYLKEGVKLVLRSFHLRK